MKEKIEEAYAYDRAMFFKEVIRKWQCRNAWRKRIVDIEAINNSDIKEDRRLFHVKVDTHVHVPRVNVFRKIQEILP